MESNNDKFTMGAEISWDVPHHQKVITIRLSFEMALLLISSFVLLVIGLAHANNVTTQQINTTTAVVKDTIALQSSETALPAASSNVQVHKNTMDNNVRADLSVKPTVEKSITLHFRTKEEKQDSAYIRRFQRVAIAEMERFNIPASVAMAQGLKASETALPAASSNVQVHKNTMDNNVRADLSVKPTVEKSITLHFRTKEEKQDSAYIRRFQRVAIAEMEQFNIPASVAMAQGLLESDGGQSRLATKANNHFGVKCHSRTCAAGHCLNSADDSHKDFFIKYPTAWESWRAHSKLLADKGKRYAELIGDCGNDYQCWAKGLKRKGYATQKAYAERLIGFIKKYQLYRLDSKQLLLNTENY